MRLFVINVMIVKLMMTHLLLMMAISSSHLLLIISIFYCYCYIFIWLFFIVTKFFFLSQYNYISYSCLLIVLYIRNRSKSILVCKYKVSFENSLWVFIIYVEWRILGMIHGANVLTMHQFGKILIRLGLFHLDAWKCG